MAAANLKQRIVELLAAPAPDWAQVYRLVEFYSTLECGTGASATNDTAANAAGPAGTAVNREEQIMRVLFGD
jgi:hypothetical protein